VRDVRGRFPHPIAMSLPVKDNDARGIQMCDTCMTEDVHGAEINRLRNALILERAYFLANAGLDINEPDMMYIAEAEKELRSEGYL